MRILDFPHQQRIVGPTTYIEQWRIPCDGTKSEVSGQIIIVAKDYTNQPTVSVLDIAFLNTIYNLLPNATINFAATVGGLAVTPVTSLKDTDVGTPIHGVITRGGELVTITVTVTVVPDPFMLYIRPMIKVVPITTPDSHLEKFKGNKIELGFTPPDSSIPFVNDPANVHMGGVPSQGVAGIDVIKRNR